MKPRHYAISELRQQVQEKIKSLWLSVPLHLPPPHSLISHLYNTKTFYLGRVYMNVKTSNKQEEQKLKYHWFKTTWLEIYSCVIFHLSEPKSFSKFKEVKKIVQV